MKIINFLNLSCPIRAVKKALNLLFNYHNKQKDKIQKFNNKTISFPFVPLLSRTHSS